MTHPSWLVASMGGALLALAIAGCSGGETYVLATITRGDVPETSPIRSIETTIDLDGRIDMTPMLAPAAGAEMVLPATLSLELASGDGLARIGANAYGDDGVPLATGSTEIVIARGDVTPVTVELGRDSVMPPDDAGMPDANDCRVSLDRTSLLFDTRTLGTSHDETIAVGNSGTGACAVLAPTLLGVGATQFELANDTCTGVALGAAATCTFAVRFRPTDVGSVGATVEMRPYASVLAGMSGSAVLFSLTPSSLGFGNVAVSTSITQTVTVKNESTTTATQGIGFLLDDTVNFAIDPSSTCTQAQTLAPTESCTIRVRFTPSSPGLESTFLHVTDRATMSLALSGTGI
jgi:hypothetical protein